MKKKLIIATVLTLGVTSAFAQQGGYTGPSSAPQASGGYTGPKVVTQTVAQAIQMRDDSKVTLRGYIIQHLGKDKYLFEDSTGKVTVEIDDDNWQGLTVGAKDLVEIYGEVDKDWNSVEIDVDRIRKVK